jgi:hypothetical protein
MVYCGKPSKGCSNCRERKIRVCLDYYSEPSLSTKHLLTVYSAIRKNPAAANARKDAKNAPATETSSI